MQTLLRSPLCCLCFAPGGRGLPSITHPARHAWGSCVPAAAEASGLRRAGDKPGGGQPGRAPHQQARGAKPGCPAGCRDLRAPLPRGAVPPPSEPPPPPSPLPGYKGRRGCPGPLLARCHGRAALRGAPGGAARLPRRTVGGGRRARPGFPRPQGASPGGPGRGGGGGAVGGGSGGLAASETDQLHGGAAGDAGAGLPGHHVPRHLPAGEAGRRHADPRVPHPGEGRRSRRAAPHRPGPPPLARPHRRPSLPRSGSRTGAPSPAASGDRPAPAPPSRRRRRATRSRPASPPCAPRSGPAAPSPAWRPRSSRSRRRGRPPASGRRPPPSPPAPASRGSRPAGPEEPRSPPWPGRPTTRRPAPSAGSTRPCRTPRTPAATRSRARSGRRTPSAPSEPSERRRGRDPAPGGGVLELRPRR